MKNSYSFRFCGIDEKCRLCNDDDCMGYGMCPILRAKAEEYAAENGALAVAVLKTKEADLIDACILDEFKGSYPEEVREPLFIFDFSEIEYEEDYHEEYNPINSLSHFEQACQWVAEGHDPIITLGIIFDGHTDSQEATEFAYKFIKRCSYVDWLNECDNRWGCKIMRLWLDDEEYGHAIFKTIPF